MGITSTRSRTRNLKYKFNTGDSAAPRPVLNFLFLVHALALLDPDKELQESCYLKFMHHINQTI